MGPVLYALLGVALGAAFAAIAAALYVRSKVAETRSACDSDAREASARLQAREEELNSQRAQHQQHLELIQAELRERDGRIREEVEARHAADVARQKTETGAAGLAEQLEKRELELGESRRESDERLALVQQLRGELAAERARADSAEREKIASLREKDEQIEQRLRDEKRSSERLLEKQREHNESLVKFVEQAKEKLGEAFDSTSAKTLQTATERFLELAQKQFGERDEQASQQFAKRKEEFEKLMEPLQKEIAGLEELNRSIEEKRAESFGSITQAIANLNKNSESLTNALKKPSIRGSWGEGQLKTILESAGMTEGTHFVVQDTTEEDGKALRTDVVINLPKDRKIVIDSKAPLDKYLAAMDASTEDERKKLCEEHARCVRAHMKDLQKKAYWNRYDGSPPYIILFLPYEAAYQIACDHDKSLLNDAHNAGIILANPMTLMNLVHLASYVMNEERIKHGAEEVRRHGQELCQRLGKVLELIAKHGAHVRLAASSFNEVVGSVDGRLLPSANRMKELGGGAEKVMKPIERIDLPVRQLPLPDGDDAPSLAGPEQVTA